MTPHCHPARSLPYGELLEQLTQAVDAKWVNVQQHGPYRLYNYTDQCVFQRAWGDHPITRIARGLVVDVENQQVVATPFPKFFNYGEGEAPEQGMPPLPEDEPFTVGEKLDGSLGVVWWREDHWTVTTRGSFTSDQAQWAKAQLTPAIAKYLSPGTTYLVEIVYAANRIVVAYPWEGLVLLGAYGPQGDEWGNTHLDEIGRLTGWRRPVQYTYSSLPELLAVADRLSHQEEGFVVRFASGRRIKIKGAEYCRVHRLVSRVTPLGVWAVMKAGDDLDNIRQQLPEEFQVDFTRIVECLTHIITRQVADLQLLLAHTADWSARELGLWLQQRATVTAVEKWAFLARRHPGWEGDVMTNHLNPIRAKIIRHIRPIGNRLAGYTPSAAVTRFTTGA